MDTTVSSEYYNQTVLHPLGLLAVLVLGIAMLLGRRRHALIPLAIMACFIAPAQRIAVFTLNFDLLRVMVLLGTARLLLRSEWRGLQWRTLDVLVVMWAVAGTLAYSILLGTLEAVKFRLGVSYDIVGVYFLGRCLIRDWHDVQALATGFVWISVPVAIAFLVEHATGHNVFAAFGGVPAITDMREGRLRCQGAFAHPILAGCFWASLMPLVAAGWWRPGRSRVVLTVGAASILTIILTCASSTPVAALFLGVVGMCLFVVRHWMRYMRWGLLVVLIGLHLVMNAPVWHLMARVDLAGGSTGWYRYLLIDEWIRNVGEWWALGVVSTAHWGSQYGLSLYDITNQFVLEGVRGGVLTLILFVAVLTAAFGDVGRIWRHAGRDRYRALLGWALGVSLFTHCTNFLAVSYFGQIRFLQYLLLAAIGSLAAAVMYKPPARPSAAKPARILASSVFGRQKPQVWC